ncbi:MAG: hypothetical protein WBW51_03870 [Methyloceanibacter sp.]
MLKHFAIAALGLAVLFGAAGPATADKSGHYWKHPSPYVYSYGGPSYAYGASPRYLSRSGRSQPNIRLDLETESVWRNLRPEWFD